jgi:CheY-like chemotaxis protein
MPAVREPRDVSALYSSPLAASGICCVNIIMPEMDGYQTIEKIRQNEA